MTLHVIWTTPNTLYPWLHGRNCQDEHDDGKEDRDGQSRQGMVEYRQQNERAAEASQDGQETCHESGKSMICRLGYEDRVEDEVTQTQFDGVV